MTRLGTERFRVVSGSGTVDADRGWIEMHAVDVVEVTDVTDDLAVIGFWGPGRATS